MHSGPVDIEETRSMKFHQFIQTDHFIETLGLELQRLAKRVFPTIKGKDFETVKGTFFQALSLMLPSLVKALTSSLTVYTQHESKEVEKASRKEQAEKVSRISMRVISIVISRINPPPQCRICHCFGHIAKLEKGKSPWKRES